jgi:molybdopterin/thiamine biosynthesis adenylyltransferase
MVMKKIAPYVSVFPHGLTGFYGIGYDQEYIKDEKFWEAILMVTSEWMNPQTEADIIEKFSSGKFSNIIDDVLKKIKDKNYLVDLSDVDFSSNRYSRNGLFYNLLGSEASETQERLSAKSVAVIGCGGIGNYISQMLSCSGLKNLSLVDPDVVELSNLTRQFLFHESDVGLKKIDVLERELILRNSSILIEKHDFSIESKFDLSRIKKPDLIVLSADYPNELIVWVNEFCVENEIAYINIGYINDISLIGPFYIPRKTACVACKNFLMDYFDGSKFKEQVDKINCAYKAPSFPATNGVAASYAFADIIRFLGEIELPLSANKRVGIHMRKTEFEIQELEINEDCSVCSLVEI